MSFSILGKIRESEEERPEFYDDLNLTQWIEEINGQLGIYDLREYFRQMPDGREQIRFRQEVLQEIDEEMEIKLTEFVNRIRQAQENEAYINSETGEQITDELSKAHWKLEVAVMYFTAVDELIAFLEERECRARGWQQFLEMCLRMRQLRMAGGVLILWMYLAGKRNFCRIAVDFFVTFICI